MNTGEKMKYDLTKPCGNCPFRSDKPFPLHYERVMEITDGLLYRNIPFSCHKTTTQKGRSSDYKDAQHCAGALIFLEKQERPHQMMRIAERLGMYDRRKLDPAAFDYVHDCEEGMADMCEAANGG